MNPAGINLHRFARQFPVMVLGALAIATAANAGGHTWDVNEVFSNASGTIQFIEIREAAGGPNEVGTANHMITSLTKSFTIPSNVTAPTSFKTLLFATPAFAALPGAPTPNYIFPAGSVPFFNINGDTISYTPFDTFTFGAGILPTDGIHSLNDNGTITCNTPTNYAGQTGFVNVGCTIPGDIDGNGTLDAGDIEGFVRVMLGTPIAGDNAACAEYCQSNLQNTVLAFVADLIS